MSAAAGLPAGLAVVVGSAAAVGLEGAVAAEEEADSAVAAEVVEDTGWHPVDPPSSPARPQPPSQSRPQ